MRTLILLMLPRVPKLSVLALAPLLAITPAVTPQSTLSKPRVGDPIVVTAGNDVGLQVTTPAEARESFLSHGELRRDTQGIVDYWTAHGPLFPEHGVTAFEPYVKWMLLEPKEGMWDPEFYDAELAQIRKHGLKWVPFLIAGPAYATPPWFKESAESVFAVDIQTGDRSRDQSIWNPYLRRRVRAWLERFFRHYDAADMQAALLGISGVFGESIYTAGGNVWTQIWDGQYPQHFGWWCGDEHARSDFKDAMKAKYRTLEALNGAWKTELKSFAQLNPFVPDSGHSARARLDMIRWYMGAMTDYAEWWVTITRELAPDVPILLCTGGSAQSTLGADMSAQTKMVAKHGAGMRITNEASDYAMNFHLTRHVASASRLYGAYFGYEPAGAVDTYGIVARVYNAVTSGAWELFHYDNPPRGERGEQYKRYLNLLRLREPVVEVAVFWPRTSVDLERSPRLGEVARSCRNICDVDYVDELMISDGALAELRVFVWAAGAVTETEAADVLRRAVEKGLTLLVPLGWKPITPEGELVFPSKLTTRSRGFGVYSVPGLPATNRGSLWREGTFHGDEPDGVWHTSRRLCWTSGNVTLHIPLPPKPGKIRLPYFVGNLTQSARFLVDDKLVKEGPRNRSGELVTEVPADESQTLTMKITVEAGTWCPADATGGGDTRQLSVMLRDVIVEPADSNESDEASSPDRADAVAAVHVLERGHVVEASDSTPTGIAEALAALLKRHKKYGVAPVFPATAIDAKLDQLYATVTTRDILLYNHGGAPIRVETPSGPINVSGHTIVTVPR